MSRRYAEVRRFMDFSALVFGYLATLTTSAGGAAKCIPTALSHMRDDVTVTVGLVLERNWQPMESLSKNRAVTYAVEFLVKNVFHATGVVAAKIGKAVRTFKAYNGATASKLLWWKGTDFDQLETADMESATGYHTKNVVGEECVLSVPVEANVDLGHAAFAAAEDELTSLYVPLGPFS